MHVPRATSQQVQTRIRESGQGVGAGEPWGAQRREPHRGGGGGAALSRQAQNARQHQVHRRARQVGDLVGKHPAHMHTGSFYLFYLFYHLF